MTQDEQVQYLANVCFLARSDSDYDIEEDSLLLEIAKSIGAGYLETRKGLDMAMADGFRIKFPARFSDQVRNLEDLMLMSIWDSRLHEMEKKIVYSYAKQLGLGKKQFDIIKKQAKSRFKGMKAEDKR